MSWLYGASLFLSMGTGGALLVDKPSLSGYAFGLGAELHLHRSWSIQGEAFVLVSDNVMGPPEHKKPGGYGAVKYRAFLGDHVYLYGMAGPAYAAHPYLVKDQMQIISEFGIGATGIGPWGTTLSWRHMSSGQVGNGNHGVDYISVAIRYEWVQGKK